MRLEQLKLLEEIDLISTLVLKLNKVATGKLRIFRKSSIQFDKSSRIISRNGIFQFNSRWTRDDPFPSLLALREDAKIVIENTFSIYSGARIYVNKNATLILGSGYINNNLNLSCFEQIEIGLNVAISENVCIRDSDNHSMLHSSNSKTKPIRIGNHVWIGMNAVILKGVTIGDGAVVAAGSVVNRDIPSRCLAGGVPARVLKNDIEWN
jgi:acetyltransferase-like isoleucine patch superfamily enzyme